MENCWSSIHLMYCYLIQDLSLHHLSSKQVQLKSEHLRMLASAGARKLKSTDERLVDYQLEDLRLESEENDPLITRNNLF